MTFRAAQGAMAILLMHPMVPIAFSQAIPQLTSGKKEVLDVSPKPIDGMEDQATLAEALWSATLRIDALGIPRRQELPNPLVILGPLTSGENPNPGPPPSDDEIARAWEQKRLQTVADPARNGKSNGKIVQIVREKFLHEAKRPRFVPLIGQAEEHHAHYLCTLHFVSEDRKQEWTETLRIDHMHFHIVR